MKRYIRTAAAALLTLVLAAAAVTFSVIQWNGSAGRTAADQSGVTDDMETSGTAEQESPEGEHAI